MGRRTGQGLVVFCCLSSLWSRTVASPLSKEKTPIIVGGNVASILTNTTGTTTFEKPKSFRRISEGLAKRDGTWTVQAGDTGNGIAARLSIQFMQLAFMNQGVDWYSLQIGQVLHIPCAEDALMPIDDDGTGSSFYTVVTADTGNDIAARSGITFEKLDAFNPGVNWYNLEIGQILILPRRQMAETTPGSATDQEGEQQGADNPATQSISSTGLTGSISLTDSTSSTESTRLTSLTSSTTSMGTTPTDVDGDSAQDNAFLNPPAANAHRIRAENARAAGPILSRSTSSALSANPSAAGAQTYTVKAGDIGLQIAAAYDIPFSDLDKANPGVTWTNLQVGQKLNFPQSAKRISTSSRSKPAPAAASTQPGGMLNRKPGTDVYVVYNGPALTPPYPSESTWMRFQNLWSSNKGFIGATCNFAAGKVTPNTASENLALKNSILAVSEQTAVNPVFILAVVMQESNGCVRVPTTSSWEGIRNPGLMQSFEGNASCNSNGRVQQPCPDSTIRQMIMEGVAGNNGVGIVPALNQAAKVAGTTWSGMSVTAGASASISASADVNANAKTGKQGVTATVKTMDEALVYYQAARIFNSGSLPTDGDLSGATGSTRCYVSDIVNRLMGWVTAPRDCSLV